MYIKACCFVNLPIKTYWREGECFLKCHEIINLEVPRNHLMTICFHAAVWRQTSNCTFCFMCTKYHISHLLCNMFPLYLLRAFSDETLGTIASTVHEIGTTGHYFKEIAVKLSGEHWIVTKMNGRMSSLWCWFFDYFPFGWTVDDQSASTRMDISCLLITSHAICR